MYSLAYGTIPLVRSVGGLADSVVDTNSATLADGTATGIVFDDYSGRAFAEAFGRCIELYNDRSALAQVRAAAMIVTRHGARAQASIWLFIKRLSLLRTLHRALPNCKLSREGSMSLHELAGKPAPLEQLENIPRLVAAYYTNQPDAADPAQRVSFGTSGHRGCSLKTTFNEAHIQAICQAIVEYRQQNQISGPLFVGMDTHALSEPAFQTAVEVFAANRLEVVVQAGRGYTPTPVVSLAILNHNRNRNSGLADGVVITPSHNPPADGGFKYNATSGGPADTDATQWIQDRANEVLASGLKEVQRIPFQRAIESVNVTEFDYIVPYVNELASVIDMQAISAAGLEDRRRPNGRCWHWLLGADCRNIRTGHRSCQRTGRPNLLVHDRGQRWQDSDGLLVSLCDGRADRAKRSI